MASHSDMELTIERKGKNESISRDEVKNIWRVKTAKPQETGDIRRRWGRRRIISPGGL